MMARASKIFKVFILDEENNTEVSTGRIERTAAYLQMPGDSAIGNASGSRGTLLKIRQPLWHMFGDAVLKAPSRSADILASASTHKRIDYVMLEPNGKAILGRSGRDAGRAKKDDGLCGRV